MQAIVALVFHCKPDGGTEHTSKESTAVAWLTPDEISSQVSEVYAIRLLDALDEAGSHVRSHDDRHLVTSRPARRPVHQIQLLMNGGATSDAVDDSIIEALQRGLQRPHIIDYIFHPAPGPEPTAEQVVYRAMAYHAIDL